MATKQITPTSKPSTGQVVPPAAPVGTTVGNKSTGLLTSQQVNGYKNALPANPALATLHVLPAYHTSKYPAGNTYRAQMAQAFVAYIVANPGQTLGQVVQGMGKKYPNGWGSVPCNAAQITGFLQPNGYVGYVWPTA